MDQSDCSVGVEYFLILTPIFHPWYWAHSKGVLLWMPVVAIEVGMDTS